MTIGEAIEVQSQTGLGERGSLHDRLEVRQPPFAPLHQPKESRVSAGSSSCVKRWRVAVSRRLVRRMASTRMTLGAGRSKSFGFLPLDLLVCDGRSLSYWDQSV